MSEVRRHKRAWAVLYKVISPFIRHKFNLHAEPCSAEGPYIVISNHVTDWDPLLLAMSFPKNNLYFVASEHLFRKGFISKLLCWFFDPIPRKKASVGSDTAKSCLRKIKQGHSICIFGEGDATWDGLTKPIMPATGKMVKISGASLVTYKIEGGYLSNPRWGKGVRRGRINVHPVKVYPPDVLKTMTPQQINDTINSDIFENAWERQKREQVEFSGKNLADLIETSLFLCPSCKKIGTVAGRGNHIRCNCGLDLLYTPKGSFEPAEPFENIAQWDAWQFCELNKMAEKENTVLFEDGNLTLSEIFPDHSDNILYKGTVFQYNDRLCCGEKTFILDEIERMSMVQNDVLLFTINGQYFEIKSENPCCLRKYLGIWQYADAIKSENKTGEE